MRYVYLKLIMKINPWYIKIVGLLLLLGGAYFVLRLIMGQKGIADFSAYAGTVAAVIGIFLMAQANNLSSRFNQLQTMPGITFSLDQPPVLHADKFIDSVKVVNITNVPVENILVRFKINRDKNYSNWVSCPSLKANEQQELFWLRFPDTIQAVYHDLMKNSYFRFTYQDSHGITDPIDKNEYEGYLQLAIANRYNNNVHLRDKFSHFIISALPLKRGSMDEVMKGYVEFISRHIFS